MGTSGICVLIFDLISHQRNMDNIIEGMGAEIA